MEVNNKWMIISSLFWKLLERGGTQTIQFIIQVILARLLAPEQFGTIAIVMVFINFAYVFVNSSFNTALIQKKDADDADFSSVFYLTIGIAVVLYIVTYFVAQYIANFYNDFVLAPVLRVLALSLFFGAINSIQNAFVARNLMFKKLFKSSLGATLISGVLAVIAAIKGLGIWALAIQHLTNQILITCILWTSIKWRPRLVFSVSRVKTLFSFGWKLLVSSLIDTTYKELRTVIIGSIYSPSILGYYNRGQQFPKLIAANVDGSIQSVMLPALSSCQDNKRKVKDMMRHSIVLSAYLIFPMMVGMAVIAEPLVKIVLTDKWLQAVPFLQIFCFSYALWPIHTANLQAINAVGRSDIFLKLEIVKKICGLIILVISLPFGIYSIAIGEFASGVISSFINAYPNKQLLDYSYKEQWLDIMPSLIISIFMGAIVYILRLILNTGALQLLIVQVLLGVLLYYGLSKLLQINAYNYLTTTIKEFVLGKKNRNCKLFLHN